ncbi:MAG TPA: hypothetical protein PLB32_12660 [Acidobacteriota bacterium]|nr:hypothetical protein [Acidobacteriota bacterium]
MPIRRIRRGDGLLRVQTCEPGLTKPGQTQVAIKPQRVPPLRKGRFS